MALEILYWLQDVREHLRVARQRRALRRPGQGIDYTRDRDTVRRVVARLHPRRMRLRLAEVVDETPTTKTFCFERVDDQLPPFRPGQYLSLLVDVDGVLTSRPYSIASPPGGTTLDLTVRLKPGGFVTPYLLHELQVGDVIETTGPAGSFYHEPLIDGEDLVFLAGGSGITPFRSIIRDALDRGRPWRMHLLYGSRTLDDVIYGNELTALAQEHSNLRYTLVISEPPPEVQARADVGGDREGRRYRVGLLDAALIREETGDVTGKTFYLCGPNAMYDFCLAALQELGVPAHKIRRELYGPPANVTQQPGWPEGLSAETLFDVEVIGRGTIRAPAGEPLLNTLERYGMVLPAVCRSGECSTCRVRLLSGRVWMPAGVGLREADRQHGTIHACVSYPLQDLRIRL